MGSTSRNKLLRHHYIGIDDYGKASILTSLASIDELEDNMFFIKEDIFHHIPCGWGGHGDLAEVLSIYGYQTTGRSLKPIHPLVFTGYDSDHGHIDRWKIEISDIYEIIKPVDVV